MVESKCFDLGKTTEEARNGVNEVASHAQDSQDVDSVEDVLIEVYNGSIFHAYPQTDFRGHQKIS